MSYSQSQETYAGNRKGFSLQASSFLSAASSSPLITVRDFCEADKGYARVILTVTHRNDSRVNKSSVFEAISSALDHNAVPVAGTWMVIDSCPTADILSGILSCNQRVIPYTNDNAKNFRMISSNMFMDDEKTMWALTETEGGKLMVRTTAYDDDKVLQELLSSLSSASKKSTKHSGIYDSYRYSGLCSSVSPFDDDPSIAGGQYIAYTSKSASNGLPGFCSGFIASTVCDDNGQSSREVIVLGHSASTYEVIDRNMILSVCSSDDMPMALSEDDTNVNLNSTSSSLRSNVSLEDILAYYKMLFCRNAEYFAKFEQRIRSRFYG